MIKRLDRSFAAAHDLPDVGVGHPFNEFQNDQLLALGGQSSNRCQQPIALLIRLGHRFGSLAAHADQRDFVQAHHLTAALIAVPVGDQVVRDAVQPGRERHALLTVAANVRHRPLKRSLSQILCFVMVARAVVNVVVNFADIALVQDSKSRRVRLGLRYERTIVLL